jgi:hypothetical protein
MSVFEAVLTKLPVFKRHQNEDELDAYEEGTRHPLSNSLKKQVLRYFPEMDASRLDGFTFERRHSTYEGASYDLLIFDSQGRLRFQGRSFRAAAPHFWAT